MSNRGTGIAVLVAALAGAAVMALATGSVIGSGTVPTAKLQPLATSDQVRGALGRNLSLTRVVVPPGAALPPHRHLGTQIARILRGTLTYSVISGSVTVRRGPAEAGASRVVRRARAGQTVRLRPGQWIVEQPNLHHRAANRGSEKVVLYLATLFPRGAPPSVPLND